MTEASAITKELRDLLGKELEPAVWEIDRQWIRKFCDAVGDSNPVWQDEIYARESRFGGVIAPPTFVLALRNDALRLTLATIDHPLKRKLNAGRELECYAPIRVGDVITVTVKLVDLTEREGKLGKMLFIHSEDTYTNQLGQVVGKLRNTAMWY